MTDGFINVELAPPVMNDKINLLRIDFEIPYAGEELPLGAVERLREKILSAGILTMLENQKTSDVQVYKMDIRHVKNES